MKASIRKIGNSAGAIFPASILKKLGLTEGDAISITEDGKRIVIERINERPRYTLNELLAQCDAKAPVTSDMAQWENMEEVGLENL